VLESAAATTFCASADGIALNRRARLMDTKKTGKSRFISQSSITKQRSGQRSLLTFDLQQAFVYTSFPVRASEQPVLVNGTASLSRSPLAASSKKGWVGFLDPIAKSREFFPLRYKLRGIGRHAGVR
jgi:hypothetical protein